MKLQQRKSIGLVLMQRAEKGKTLSLDETAFRDMESAARLGDSAALEMRLRSLQRTLGIMGLPNAGG
jgi:hypothetical protein